MPKSRSRSAPARCPARPRGWSGRVPGPVGGGGAGMASSQRPPSGHGRPPARTATGGPAPGGGDSRPLRAEARPAPGGQDVGSVELAAPSERVNGLPPPARRARVERMSPVTPDRPSRPGGAEPPDDRPVDRAAPARRVPAPRAGGSPRGRAPLPVAAGFAAGWAASPPTCRSPSCSAWSQLGAEWRPRWRHRTPALAGWLLGHGVPLQHRRSARSGSPRWCSPCSRSGGSTGPACTSPGRSVPATPRSPRRALLAAVAIGIAYALLGALAAVLVGDGRHRCVADPGARSRSRARHRSPRWSASLRSTAATRLLAPGFRGPLRDGVRTGLVAALFLLGAGAGAAGLSVAIGGGQAADMICGVPHRGRRAGRHHPAQPRVRAERRGLGGRPTCSGRASRWAPTPRSGSPRCRSAPLPTVPLLAGLPTRPGGRAGAAAARGAGAGRDGRRLAAGPAGGRLAGRSGLRSAGPRCWPPAVLAGPVAGVLLGAAAAVSGGPLGAGPAGPGRAGGLAGRGRGRPVVIAVGALLGAAAIRALARPAARERCRHPGADPRSRAVAPGPPGQPGAPRRIRARQGWLGRLTCRHDARG